MGHQNTYIRSKKSGFTIVELLIVVIVIAILATITIVSFNNISQRSRYSVMQSDISIMNKAIIMFHSEKGYYPNSGTTSGNITGPRINIPGLSEYLPNPPTMPSDGLNGYYAYIWSSGGADYKLVRLVPGGSLPQVEQGNTSPDATRSGRGWGVWSSGGSGL